ncbi:MAG: potassium channel family protein [Acutalibacteraceae bacterium]
MKSILVIGTGRFGRHFAKKMNDLGNDVVIVDKDAAVISALEGDFTDAQIGDCTNEHIIKSLGVSHFDICFVAIGDDFQSSLVVTSLLKTHGAKYIVSKAKQDIQADLLRKIGADEIVYPEKETAEKLAVRHNAKNVFDFLPISSDFAIVEIPILPSWIGKTVVEADVRRLHNINIVCVKKGNAVKMASADYIFAENDHIVVFGTPGDIFKLSAKIGA